MLEQEQQVVDSLAPMVDSRKPKIAAKQEVSQPSERKPEDKKEETQTKTEDKKKCEGFLHGARDLVKCIKGQLESVKTIDCAHIIMRVHGLSTEAAHAGMSDAFMFFHNLANALEATISDGTPLTDKSAGVLCNWLKSYASKASDRYECPEIDENEIIFKIIAGEAIEDMKPINDREVIGSFVNHALEHLETGEKELLELETNPRSSETINSVFRCFHSLKGEAGLLRLKRISDIVHEAETILDIVRQGIVAIDKNAVDVLLKSVDVLKRLIDQDTISSGTNPQLANRCELTVLRLKAVGATMAVEASEVSHGAVEQAVAEDLIIESEKKVREEKVSIRVDAERIQRLVDMVDELLIVESTVMQDPHIKSCQDTRLQKNVNQLDKITRELQDISRSICMVTMHTAFQRMRRMVRDLATEMCKEITFETEGADTQIDRKLVELITDPLMHMVRNAVDHGIETVDERVKVEKPKGGKIILRAFHEGQKVVIQIIDDGRGLNRDAILQKALEKGLAFPGHKLLDQEIYQFIFHPGFSTAEKVTSVSGQGIGMDVVATNLKKLGGQLHIESEPGKGSTFTMQLPLTISNH